MLMRFRYETNCSRLLYISFRLSLFSFYVYNVFVCAYILLPSKDCVKIIIDYLLVFFSHFYIFYSSSITFFYIDYINFTTWVIDVLCKEVSGVIYKRFSLVYDSVFLSELFIVLQGIMTLKYVSYKHTRDNGDDVNFILNIVILLIFQGFINIEFVI